MSEEGAGPWTPYFQTADADTTAKTVEQAGGTVRIAPDDVFTKGRMAGFTDPGGAEFAVWQPGTTKGLDLVTENGSLAWFELHVPDPEAVRPFYRAVFDWKIEDILFGDMPYLLLSTSEGENAALGGVKPLQAGDRPHWLPYFEVADCDASVVRARELGGELVAPAADIEGVGRFAVVSDPTARASPSSPASADPRGAPGRRCAAHRALRADQARSCRVIEGSVIAVSSPAGTPSKDQRQPARPPRRAGTDPACGARAGTTHR